MEQYALAILVMLAVSAFLQAGGNALPPFEADTTPDLMEEDSCATEQTRSFNCKFAPPVVQYGKHGATVRVEGAQATLARPGSAVLPYRGTVLAFPLGTHIVDVICTISEPQRLHIKESLHTTQSLRVVGTGAALTESDTTVSGPVPDAWQSHRVGGGLLNGEHATIFSLHLYPVRYDADAATLTYVECMNVTVTYRLPTAPLPAADEYDLVVVTHEEFTGALTDFVEHKERHDIRTVVVTVDDIENGVYFTTEGRDTPERIKYFVKDALEQWGVSHVLLVGDLAHVPSRRVHSFFWGDTTMYSDHYYADIYDGERGFATWDTNDNDRFGETDSDSRDDVDLYADVYVGRLACCDVAEVQTVTEKIIAYENTAYGASWFDRLIVMGGDTFPGWGPVEGELVNEEVIAALPEFEPVRLQTSLGTLLPWTINQEWSDGAGLICYSGHGFEYGFGTHPEDDPRWIAYYTPYLLWLENADRLPVVFFDACLTAKLDYYLLGNPDIPNFAWCLMKKPDGGAIATVGATETAITSVDEDGIHGAAGYMDLHFFMAYEPGIAVSQMLVQAQNDYLNDLATGDADDRLYEMTIEQFILFGDPTLKVGGYP
jgi:hypothetical protein